MAYPKMILQFTFLVCSVIWLLPLKAEEKQPAETDDESFWSDWAFGVGVGAGFFPHYPGSDQSQSILGPFPYPEYHGEILKIDSGGAEAKLFQADWINLDFSVNGSLPVSDDDNRAREGLDDLEFILEVGPALELTLASTERSALRLDIPVRAALELTLDELPKDAGFLLDPRLHYEFTRGNWEFDFNLGALFATERYHSLYYDVPAEFVTDTREFFEASAGLTGWRLAGGANYRRGNWIFVANTRYLNFSEAENRDSPLFIENDYFAAGLAVIWLFKTPK